MSQSNSGAAPAADGTPAPRKTAQALAGPGSGRPAGAKSCTRRGRPLPRVGRALPAGRDAGVLKRKEPRRGRCSRRASDACGGGATASGTDDSTTGCMVVSSAWRVRAAFAQARLDTGRRRTGERASAFANRPLNPTTRSDPTRRSLAHRSAAPQLVRASATCLTAPMAFQFRCTAQPKTARRSLPGSRCPRRPEPLDPGPRCFRRRPARTRLLLAQCVRMKHPEGFASHCVSRVVSASSSRGKAGEHRSGPQRRQPSKAARAVQIPSNFGWKLEDG